MSGYCKECGNQHCVCDMRQDMWISVNDRLPEKYKCNGLIISESVLVYKDCGDNTIPSYSVSFFWINEKKWNVEKDGYRVTHWQPLPKPPKIEEI